MSFFQRPIITGNWEPNTYTYANWIFKAFQKNDEQVQIKIYKKRWNPVFSTRVIAEMTISNNDFYTKFVPNLNAVETGELPIRRDTTNYIENPVIEQLPKYENALLYGKWTCDEADKQRVLANMPANPLSQALLSDFHGGKRHKRSGKKRKSQTKCKSHKRGHKRSGHKKSRRRLSTNCV